MGKLGGLLRETREARGLSLREVEQITKIRLKLLEALEREDFAQLPAPVFVKGFLRNYAQLLGLEAEEVIALYKEVAGDDAAPYAPKALAEPLAPSPIPLPWLIAAVLFLSVLGLTAWWSYQRGWINMSGLQARRTETATLTWLPSPSPTELAATATLRATDTATFIASTATKTLALIETPTPSLSSTPTATMTSSPTTTSLPGANISVRLELLSNAWLRVYADGERVFEGLVGAGTLQVWDAQKQLYVHCGAGNAVRATVNGREYGLLGENSDTVRVEWTLAAGTPSVASTMAPTQVIISAGTATPSSQRATQTATSTPVP